MNPKNTILVIYRYQDTSRCIVVVIATVNLSTKIASADIKELRLRILVFFRSPLRLQLSVFNQVRKAIVFVSELACLVLASTGLEVLALNILAALSVVALETLFASLFLLVTDASVDEALLVRDVAFALRFLASRLRSTVGIVSRRKRDIIVLFITIYETTTGRLYVCLKWSPRSSQ